MTTDKVNNSIAQWEQLEAACSNCAKCALSRTRTNCVFGVGNKNASLMFVGEAPGREEDMSGVPFVGAAGRLLDKYLTAVDIDRNEVYIANILKCRPPQNRDPLPEEEDFCIPYLMEQIRLIKPSLVVCLGRIAAARLIHNNFKISKEHGVFVPMSSYMITAVYHPAALLRDPRRREDMLKDMKQIKFYLDEIKNGRMQLTT